MLSGNIKVDEISAREVREIIRSIQRDFGANTGPGESKSLWAALLAGMDDEAMIASARAKIPVRTGKLRRSFQKRSFKTHGRIGVSLGYKYRLAGQRRGVHLRQVVAAEYDVKQGGPFANAIRHIANNYSAAIIQRARKELVTQVRKRAKHYRVSQSKYGEVRATRFR